MLISAMVFLSPGLEVVDRASLPQGQALFKFRRAGTGPAALVSASPRVLPRLAAAADQVIGGRPVDQAFLTLGMEGQAPVAVQHAGRGPFLSETIDDVVATQAYIHLFEAAIGETPLDFGLAVTNPAIPLLRRRRLTAAGCQQQGDGHEPRPFDSAQLPLLVSNAVPAPDR